VPSTLASVYTPLTLTAIHFGTVIWRSTDCGGPRRLSDLIESVPARGSRTT